MKKFRELKSDQLSQINGGKYYGNGVTCTKKHGCSVNWGTGWGCVLNRSSIAISQGSGSASGYAC